MNEAKDNSLYTRTEMLLGAERTERLKKSSAAVCGLGGVGSYAAEALMRSGVGELRLIDRDTIDITNLNRQLYASISALGRKKSELAFERARDINPNCRVSALCENITEQNVADLIPADCGIIIDAIDDIPAKLALIRYAVSGGIPIICSMGMGNKLDITKLKIADIEHTSVCPLARELRKRLRAEGIKNISCVFSTEVPLVKTPTPSSMIFVPAAAGLMMAEYAVSLLCGGMPVNLA